MVKTFHVVQAAEGLHVYFFHLPLNLRITGLGFCYDKLKYLSWVLLYLNTGEIAPFSYCLLALKD